MPETVRLRHGARGAGDLLSPPRRSGEGVAATVREAMVRRPKTLPVDVTLAEASAAFAGGHVHMLLLTDGQTLVGTLVAADLPTYARTSAAGAGPALRHASLRGRTVSPDALAADVEHSMIARGLRRLAVVDGRGALLGLMCLKRQGRGFCSDEDVAHRAGDRRRHG